MDPNASGAEKLASAGGLLLGFLAPGGGYGTAAKQGAKYIDNAAREGAEMLIDVGGKQVDNIDDYYKATKNMDVGERVASHRQTGKKIAETNGWTKNKNLSKKNGRDVYTDNKGNNYSVDTQHGAFEVLNKKGKHQGEIDFSGKWTKDADTSGKHNIKI